MVGCVSFRRVAIGSDTGWTEVEVAGNKTDGYLCEFHWEYTN